MNNLFIAKALVVCGLFFYKADAKSKVYKFESSVVCVKVKKKSYPKGEVAEPFISTGAGVIVSDDGYIITSSLLIGEATSAGILLDTGAFSEAKVVARDPETDIALLKAPASKLNPVEWEPYFEKGEQIFVISMAYNILFSIVRSTACSLQIAPKFFGSVDVAYGNVRSKFKGSVFQYVAVGPITPGAPIFNKDGKLIGLTTPVYDRLHVNGFAFALVSKEAERVCKQLIKHGRVIRKHIGVHLQEVDETLFKAASMHLIKLTDYSHRFGVIITKLQKDSVAAKLLKEEDIIYAVNGQTIKNVEELQVLVENADGKLVFDVWRKSSTKSSVQDVAAKQPSNDKISSASSYEAYKIELAPVEKKAIANENEAPKEMITKQLRLVEYNSEDALMQSLSGADKDTKHGLFVVKVLNSNLAKVLCEHDLILKIQGKPVKTIKEADAVITESLKKQEKYIILLLIRNGRVGTYVISAHD